MTSFARRHLHRSDQFLQIALSIAIALAILFARSADSFLHPIAGGEDATQGLNYYTSASPTILHYYAGYISFLPNVLDWAFVRLLPLQAVPFAQAYFALLAAACLAPALACFLRHVLDWPNPVAIVTGIFVTCLPWGDFLAVSNTEYSIWSLLAILLLTALNPVNPSIGGGFRFVTWRLAVIASTPVSVICVPVWCVLGWCGREDRGRVVVYASLTIATLLYAGFGIEHAPVFATASGIQSTGLAAGLDAALRLATDKSLLAILIRDICRINLAVIPASMAVLALIGAGLLGWNVVPKPVRAQPSLRLAVGYLLWLIAAVCLACGLGRGMANGSASVLASPRYHTVPQLLWLTVFAVVIHARVVSHFRYRALILGVAVICSVLMWQKGLKSYVSRNSQASSEIIAFLKRAEAQRSVGNFSEMRYRRIGPDGDWSIILFATARDHAS